MLVDIWPAHARVQLIGHDVMARTESMLPDFRPRGNPARPKAIVDASQQ